MRGVQKERRGIWEGCLEKPERWRAGRRGAVGIGEGCVVSMMGEVGDWIFLGLFLIRRMSYGDV